MYDAAEKRYDLASEADATYPSPWLRKAQIAKERGDYYQATEYTLKASEIAVMPGIKGTIVEDLEWFKNKEVTKFNVFNPSKSKSKLDSPFQADDKIRSKAENLKATPGRAAPSPSGRRD